MLSRCTHCLRPLVRATTARPIVPLRHFSLLPSSSSLPSLRPSLTPSTLRPHPRRFISIPAQAPTNPSEDFEPLSPSEVSSSTTELSMSLTDSAIKQIERAQALKKDEGLALRLMVESGGCHGYQYKMAVTSTRDQDDYLFEPENTTAKLLVDSASLPLVNGSTIDYATELIGSSFRVMNNPQSKDAGCGCGVSWELKDL
ncbi:Isa2p [Sporobolomyces salmoneus]|uniref:Isa2p n=1 Tax=Sporobolomyces salmoneus TaxID=183962 RepID=UPI00316FFF7E